MLPSPGPSSPPAPTTSAKRNRRNGLVHPPVPEVPPSPPLPPLPPKSPLRLRSKSAGQRQFGSVSTIDISPLPSPVTIAPPNLSQQQQNGGAIPMGVGMGGMEGGGRLQAPQLDVGISSSPLSISSSTFAARPSSDLPTPVSVSSASSLPSAHAPQPQIQTSKRTHALRELLTTERAYASDLALVRDVYIHLARDPVAPFTAATPPPPAKARIRSAPTRPHTASTPPISPSPSASSINIGIKPLKRKSSSPAFNAPAPRHKQPLSEADIRTIFMNIDKLAALSSQLCERLEAAMRGTGEDEGADVGQIMLDFLPRMTPLYRVYISKHPAALQHLTSLTPSIQPYLTTARALTLPHTTAWDLPSLLIKPAQRFVKYPLLLAALIDATPGQARGSIQLREARRLAESACAEINEAKRRWEEVGKVLRGAKARKFAVVLHPGPTPMGLAGGEVEAWDRKLEEAEKSVRRVAREAMEWGRAARVCLVRLVEWAEAAERVVLVGMREGEDDDGRGRWARAVVEGILVGCWKPLDARLHLRLLPQIAALLSALAPPRLLLTALRAPLPHTLAEPVRAQLRLELPRLLALLGVALAKCVSALASWQAAFWEGVRREWGRALGEEEWLPGVGLGLGVGVGAGEELVEREPTPAPGPPVQQEKRPKAARHLSAADVTAAFYGLPLAHSSDSLDRTPIAAPLPPPSPRPPSSPRAPPSSTLSPAKARALTEALALSPTNPNPNSKPLPPPTSRTASASSSLSYEPSRVKGLYTLAGAQSSSSVMLPDIEYFHAANPNGNGFSSPPSIVDRERDGSVSTPSLLRESVASSREVVHLDEPRSSLKGLHIDDALRSMGLVDSPEQMQQPAHWDTPPSTAPSSRPSSAGGGAVRRLKSASSARSLAKLFRREEPPLPSSTPWASAYAYAPQSPAQEDAPQRTLSRKPSFQDKVRAFRHGGARSSSGSGSPRSVSSALPPPSSYPLAAPPPPPPPLPPTPPAPKQASFLVSPITAFHLPSPRHAPYTFHGLPFLTLRVGDVIRVTQDAGRPRDYRDFPLWTDGQEDRLLIGRGEDGAEGWLLASFVVPVT